MNKTRRAIFFWTLVALFLIITPIIVLDALGYRFDFHRGVFVHSGTITLKTNPQNFNVYMDGVLESSKQLNRINNSYNLTGLLPKSYEVTISAEEYQTWKKNMDIHSGISTEFWNIILARNNYTRTAFGTDGTEKFFISPKNDYIAIENPAGSAINVGILSISDKTTINNFSFSGWQFTDDLRQENIEWSPNGDFISIPLKKTTAPPAVSAQKKNSLPTGEITEYAYFVADPSSDSNSAFNLNDFVGKPDIKNVRWDPQDKNYIFFMSVNSLYRAHITDNSDVTTVAENVSSFDLSKTGIYFAQMPNELVFKKSLDGKSEASQITFSFPDQLSDPNKKLIVYDDARIAFLSANNNLYIYNHGDIDTYFKKLRSDVSGMQFSDDGKKLLFWSGNEVSVYFLRQWGVQPERKEDETQTITRYSDTIKNIQWFKDYEHVIFSSGPYVKIIELDARDHRISMDLLKTNIDSPFIIYNNYLENLFFADSNDNVSDLYSIVFPEPGGFLGLFPPPAQP